jgi:hypothetical protein
MVATTLNGSGLFQYEQRSGDPDPFGNFPEARLNEAALRRTLSRARRKRHRRFETRSLAEWSVSRYDEAIVSLSFFGYSMNSDSKIVPATLCFSTTCKPKSIEIP